MNLMIHQQANREELVERTLWTMRQDGSTQPLQGLHLYRYSFPLAQVYSVVEPYVWAVAQDSKGVLCRADFAAYRGALFKGERVATPSQAVLAPSSSRRSH